uniref:NADH dehydrogenase subunit 4L n=1 Tax=Anastatus shichengensis TaxID=3025492 RepID=UPI0023AAA4A9|nr:NADH dehydrogenase subunit 4L [Anastatus shichengensis]WCO11510.1 NADH dehydrogenase subunit 4L [Anastatus shichengensis]
MFLNYYFFLNLFIFFCFMFSMFYNQIFMSLMMMEFMMIMLFMFLLSIFIHLNLSILMLYYLVFVVCESVLGLTLLILMFRGYGNDNLKLINLLMW